MNTCRYFAIAALSLVACQGKLHSPDRIAQEMLPVLIDFESVNRAERCEELLKLSDDFESGKPYEVVGLSSGNCKIVSKTNPDKSVYGDLVFPSDDNCNDVSKAIAQHENNLRAKIQLACGPDGKPTTAPDASVQLAARLALRDRLAETVKAANGGEISAEISKCYFGVKQEMLKVATAIKKSRCEAINNAEKIKNFTFDALWTHAHLNSEVTEYQKTHSEAWEKASKEQKLPELFSQFNQDAKSKACSPKTERDLADQRLAATTAAETCM